MSIPPAKKGFMIEERQQELRERLHTSGEEHWHSLCELLAEAIENEDREGGRVVLGRMYHAALSDE